MIKKLKSFYSMHHGFIVIISIGLGHLLNPFIGAAVACYGTGYYDGREIDQAQHRKWSNDPRVIAQHIEWWDFVTPKMISVAYLVYFWFATLKDMI